VGILAVQLHESSLGEEVGGSRDGEYGFTPERGERGWNWHALAVVIARGVEVDKVACSEVASVLNPHDMHGTAAHLLALDEADQRIE
jgi:hypothetical protein